MEHYDEIFLRTSELYDCAFRDKLLSIAYECDDRIPEPAWQDCLQQQSDQCFLDVMTLSTDGTGICSSIDEMMLDNTDASNQSMCACDR